MADRAERARKQGATVVPKLTKGGSVLKADRAFDVGVGAGCTMWCAGACAATSRANPCAMCCVRVDRRAAPAHCRHQCRALCTGTATPRNPWRIL